MLPAPIRRRRVVRACLPYVIINLMNRKGSVPIIVLFIVVGAFVVGGALYYKTHRPTPPPLTNTTISPYSQLASSSPSDGTTFVSSTAVAQVETPRFSGGNQVKSHVINRSFTVVGENGYASSPSGFVDIIVERVDRLDSADELPVGDTQYRIMDLKGEMGPNDVLIAVYGQSTNKTPDDIRVKLYDWLRLVDNNSGETYSPLVLYSLSQLANANATVKWEWPVFFIVPVSSNLSLQVTDSDGQKSLFGLNDILSIQSPRVSPSIGSKIQVNKSITVVGNIGYFSNGQLATNTGFLTLTVDSAIRTNDISQLVDRNDFRSIPKINGDETYVLVNEKFTNDKSTNDIYSDLNADLYAPLKIIDTVTGVSYFPIKLNASLLVPFNSTLEIVSKNGPVSFISPPVFIIPSTSKPALVLIDSDGQQTIVNLNF